jgi:hypothetical protein
LERLCPWIGDGVMAVRDVVQAAAGVGGGDNLYVEDVFSTYLYTGNSTARDIQNDIDLDGEGGMVWIKWRSGGQGYGNHELYDTNRGATKAIESSSVNAEATRSGGLTAFNSDGFSLGTFAYENGNGNFASWSFRKSPKFFDVVTWTGNNTPRIISHNLDTVPGCIIVKRTDASDIWAVWHRSLNNATATSPNGLVLNSDEETGIFDSWFNGTQITSTGFGIKTNSGINASGGSYAAYVFAHDAGGFGDDGEQNVISCGSYTGTGSYLNVELGFEPQWLLVKCVSGEYASGTDWQLLDVMRGLPVGGNEYGDAVLKPNSSAGELNNGTESRRADPTATGFIVTDDNVPMNRSGHEFIYIAIRRGPMKTPESGTEVFAIGQGDGDSDVPDYISNFPVDTAITKRTSAGNNGRMSSRLTGANYLSPNLTQAESADSAATFDFMNGWGSDGANRNTDEYAWMFRRAPSVFDVVCYTGTGVAGHVVNHNLGVAPEWIITKKRTSTGFQDWYTVSSVYYNTIPYDRQSALTMPNGFTGGGYISGADSTSFTLSTIYIGNEAGAPIITYLFASAPNVSKVGTYTGTGSDVKAVSANHAQWVYWWGLY